MAYVLVTPKKSGISIKGIGRIWYIDMDREGTAQLSVVTELNVLVDSSVGFVSEEEPKHLHLDPERRVRLADDSGLIHVEFLVQAQGDGYLKFVFFNTGPDGNTNHTHVIKGGERCLGLCTQ